MCKLFIKQAQKNMYLRCAGERAKGRKGEGAKGRRGERAKGRKEERAKGRKGEGAKGRKEERAKGRRGERAKAVCGVRSPPLVRAGVSPPLAGAGGWIKSNLIFKL
jgi:hypothetical protein